MVKPLQGREMSAVTNYISVSILLAGVRQCSWTSESWDMFVIWQWFLLLHVCNYI